jgi:hypothetical protein
MRHFIPVLFTALVFQACNCGSPEPPAGNGENGGNESASDAGSAVDSGMPAPDAGTPAVDSGPITDAGLPPDAGNGMDSGIPNAADAGLNRDGGSGAIEGGMIPVDAGEIADAAQSPDANGVSQDAGGALDSGRPDAGQVNVDSGTPGPGMDSGTVINLDAGLDSGIDSGRDSDFDSGLDAGAAAGTDSGLDEYGDHTVGKNRYDNTNGGQSWYITADSTHLYIAITAADKDHAMVLYVDTDGSAGGMTDGFTFDGTTAAPLPFAANLVVYAKAGYNQYRLAQSADGGWAWGPQQDGNNGITSVDDGNNLRELAIPWSVVGGMPASFSFLGYVVDTAGTNFAYGEIPEGNPVGAFGTAAHNFYFQVDDSYGLRSNAFPFEKTTNIAGADGG